MEDNRLEIMNIAVASMVIAAFFLGWITQTLLEMLLPKWF